MADLSKFLDFMDEVDERDGFDSPPMPSPAHPEGKQYRVPSPDAKIGLRLNALADMTLKQSRGLDISETDVKRLRLDDKDEHEFLAQVLSQSLLDQMVEDGVKWEHLRRLAMYGFVYFAVSREAADQAAENGLFAGKALASTNRATRRGTKKTSSGSSGSKKTKKAN
jgi:hypothetical protein